LFLGLDKIRILITSYEIKTKIIYQALIYFEGERIVIIESLVFSGKSTFYVKEIPDVFKNGVKVVSENMHKKNSAQIIYCVFYVLEIMIKYCGFTLSKFFYFYKVQL
jgi:hypothetical protein